MTNIYFVRHAEPNYLNHNDRERELTEKGLEDRKLVTKYLSDKEIDKVISSPYKRSIDTVKQFADSIGCEIELIDDFRERKVGEAWIDDFNDFVKRQWKDFSYKLQGGESLGEVQSRNIAALKKILDRYKGKNIVVGSHGTALSTIINYFNKDYGFKDFNRIKDLFPWIVKITFEEDLELHIEYIDVFTYKNKEFNVATK